MVRWRRETDQHPRRHLEYRQLTGLVRNRPCRPQRNGARRDHRVCRCLCRCDRALDVQPDGIFIPRARSRKACDEGHPVRVVPRVDGASDRQRAEIELERAGAPGSARLSLAGWLGVVALSLGGIAALVALWRPRFRGANPPRWVTPAQLSDVIVFLLSDRASAVTGALLPVMGRV